ncbi:MAG: zinc ABC transporter substrate-binding protein [Armatimonadota bacterium]|nr:zinc ABC transporter substrate-binding protein [Armatimonadota bacterium]
MRPSIDSQATARPSWQLVGVLVLALVAGCSPRGAPSTSSGTSHGSGPAGTPVLRAVATYSVIADLARQVGGDRVQVVSLVPPGTDPHTYEPRPDDLKRVADAHVIFYNGLNLELWFDKLVRGSGTRARVVVASTGVTPIVIRDPLSRYDGAPDPHAWMDVRLVIQHYVPTIRDAFIALDPAGADHYRRTAERYVAELDALDRAIRAQVATIPPPRRKLVTTENAMHYFAARYGFTVVGWIYTLAPEAEPPARRIVELVGKIRQEAVPALFVDVTLNRKLMERLSQETGVPIRGALYIDSLGAPGSGADTYAGMMRANTALLVRGLGGNGP